MGNEALDRLYTHHLKTHKPKEIYNKRPFYWNTSTNVNSF